MRFIRLSDIQHSTLFSSYFSQLCRFVVVCSCTTLFQPGLFQWLISSKDYILDVFHYIRCVRIFECYEDQNGQFTERFLPCTCLCCLVPLMMHFREEQDTSSMTDQRPFWGLKGFMLVLCGSRPDITVPVDWAENTNLLTYLCGR